MQVLMKGEQFIRDPLIIARPQILFVATPRHIKGGRQTAPVATAEVFLLVKRDIILVVPVRPEIIRRLTALTAVGTPGETVHHRIVLGIESQQMGPFQLMGNVTDTKLLDTHRR